MNSISEHLAPYAVLSGVSDSGLRQSYEVLVRNLSQRLEREDGICTAVVSRVEGDGRSLVALNLAIAMGMQGKHVLLADFDLEHGALTEFFRREHNAGLYELLTTDAEFRGPVLAQSGHGIDFLPTGKVSEAEALRALESKRLPALMERMRERYEAVVLDLPVMTAVSDALTLARLADAVLIPVWGEDTRYAALRGLLRLLRRQQIPVTGLVYLDGKA